MVGARRTWAVSVLHMAWKKQLQNNFHQKIEPDEKQSRNINFTSNGALAGEAGIEVNRFCSRRPRSYGGRWAPDRPQSRGGVKANTRGLVYRQPNGFPNGLAQSKS